MNYLVFLFSPWWWEYLLEKPLTIEKLWCRFRGHPNGVIWYSNGFEPDMRCKDCGDEL